MGLVITIDGSRHYIREIVGMRRRKHDSTALVRDIMTPVIPIAALPAGNGQLSDIRLRPTR
jgi:hypothetical protein